MKNELWLVTLNQDIIGVENNQQAAYDFRDITREETGVTPKVGMVTFKRESNEKQKYQLSVVFKQDNIHTVLVDNIYGAEGLLSSLSKNNNEDMLWYGISHKTIEV